MIDNESATVKHNCQVDLVDRIPPRYFEDDGAWPHRTSGWYVGVPEETDEYLLRVWFCPFCGVGLESPMNEKVAE